MSLNNDYTVQLLVKQQQTELRARAAQERLAREFRGQRTSWWQRLTTRSTGTKRPAMTMPRHRVAH